MSIRPGSGHSLGEIIGCFLVSLRSNRTQFESSVKASRGWCPEQAIEALLQLHRPPMSTKNQRLTYLQFIYNSTVLSTEFSTVHEPPSSTPPGALCVFYRCYWFCSGLQKGAFGERSWQTVHMASQAQLMCLAQLN
mgnify:CR=1 FL=1